MLAPGKFVSLWGKVDLFSFPSELLRNIDIPESSKSFLCDAGLPLTIVGTGRLRSVLLPVKTMSGYKHTLLAVSPFVTSRYKLLSILERENIWSTPEYDKFLAVEEGSGKVYCVGPPYINPVEPNVIKDTNVLVNSSIPQFAECLLAYEEILLQTGWNFVTDCKDFTCVDLLERRWQEIDPAAMAASEYWWPWNIGYMRDC